MTECFVVYRALYREHNLLELIISGTTMSAEYHLFLSPNGLKVNSEQFRFLGKLPTYPSPKLTLTHTPQLGQKRWLRRGVGGQFPRNLD